jgi:carbon storage regulator CsrA
LQQQIKIGEQITVTILKVKGNTVRVGITAPREVRVVRGELPQKLDAASAPIAATAGEVTADDLNEELPEASDEMVEESVISFRLRCADEGTADLAAETTTQVSAAHLPLRRVYERFGGAPLKQLMASCSTVAK